MSADSGEENVGEFMEKYCPEILEKYKQLDEETSYEERRKIRAALRELRKKKVEELAKPLSETYSSSTLLTSSHVDSIPQSTGTVSSFGSVTTGQDLSVITNGDGSKGLIDSESERSVIDGLNLDEIIDEQELQKLIDSTPLTAYNDRKKLRARLRQVKKEKASELIFEQVQETQEEKKQFKINKDESSVQAQAAPVDQEFVVENKSSENAKEDKIEPELTEAEIKARIAAEKAEIARAKKAKAKAALQAKKEAEERARLEEQERIKEAERLRLEEEKARKEEEELRAKKEAEERALKEKTAREEENARREREEQAKREAQEKARDEENARREMEEQAKKVAEMKAKEEENVRREIEEQANREAKEMAQLEVKANEESLQEETDKQNKEWEREELMENDTEDGKIHDNNKEKDENEELYDEWASQKSSEHDDYSRVYEDEFPDTESVSSHSSESSSLSSHDLLKPRLPTSAFRREKTKQISEHEKEAREAKQLLRKTEQSERLMGMKGSPHIKTDVKETVDFKSVLRKVGDEPAGVLKKKEQLEEEQADFKQNLRRTGEDLTKKKAGVKKDVEINTVDFRHNLKKTEVSKSLYKTPVRKAPKPEKDKPQKFQLRETGQSPAKKVSMENRLKAKEKQHESSPASPKLKLRDTGIHLPGKKTSTGEEPEEKKPFKRITSDELMACLAQSDLVAEKQKTDYMKQRGIKKPTTSQFSPIKPLLPSVSIEEQQKDIERVVSGSSIVGRLDAKELVDIKIRQMEKLKETEVKPEFRNVLKKAEVPKKSSREEVPEEALEWIKKPKSLQKKVTEENVDEVYKKNIIKPKEKPEWMIEKESYHTSKARVVELRKLEENREAKKVNIKHEGQKAEFKKEFSQKPSHVPKYTVIKKHQLSAEPAAPADQMTPSIALDPKAELSRFRNELLKAAQAKESRESGSGSPTKSPVEVKVVWSDPKPASTATDNTVEQSVQDES